MLCPFIVVTCLQPKIRTTTSRAITVLCSLKEPGGTRPVMSPTSTVCTIKEGHTHLTLMVSTGFNGKDITTPSNEPR